MSVTETEPKNNPELSATEDVLITRNDRMITKLTNPNQDRIRIAKSHTGQKISYAWHKKFLRWFAAFGLILLAGIGGIVSGKFPPQIEHMILSWRPAAVTTVHRNRKKRMRGWKCSEEFLKKSSGQRYLTKKTVTASAKEIMLFCLQKIKMLISGYMVMRPGVKHAV